MSIIPFRVLGDETVRQNRHALRHKVIYSENYFYLECILSYMEAEANTRPLAEAVQTANIVYLIAAGEFA